MNIGEAGGGAIAEVGAFRGVLSDRDIWEIESALLERHNISRATDQTVIDGKHGFDITALIHQQQPWTLIRRVPLSIAARERSVTWTRHEPVTGRKLKVSRIGTNKFDSDSDW